MSHRPAILGLVLIAISLVLVACDRTPPAVPTARLQLPPTAMPTLRPTLTSTPRPSPTASPTTSVPQTPTVVVAQTIHVANTDGDGVIVRSSPRMDARTSTVLPEGQAMTMAAQVDGWARIVAPADGYIPPQYWSYQPPALTRPTARVRDPHASGPSTFPVTMVIDADGDGAWLRDCTSANEGKYEVVRDGIRLTVQGRINTQTQDYYEVIGPPPNSRRGCIPVQWLCCVRAAP